MCMSPFSNSFPPASSSALEFVNRTVGSPHLGDVTVAEFVQAITTCCERMEQRDF